MANIPVNALGVVTTTSVSATGSFAGIQSLGTGSASAITGSILSAFKYGTALSANGSIIESVGPSITIPAGTTINLFVTSASLAAGSAPVVLFT